MNGDNIQLPRMANVSILSGAFPRIMEIADPLPELYHRLKLEQLIAVMKVDLKYQDKMLTMEMNRLKVQQDAVEEMGKLLSEFAR